MKSSQQPALMFLNGMMQRPPGASGMIDCQTELDDSSWTTFPLLNRLNKRIVRITKIYITGRATGPSDRKSDGI